VRLTRARRASSRGTLPAEPRHRMYTLELLLADVHKLRGPVGKRSGSDGGYRNVWDAFNRYLSHCMEQHQTLNIPNFCKLGWRIDEQGRNGKPARLRPHFQMADTFVRAYGIDARAHPSQADKTLTTAEDFNFSKAAIRYSQDLTKENLFMGLRAIIQQLGEVISKGQKVSIDFEVGRLFGERELRFSFVADIYLNEGLPVPEGTIEATDYKPAATFAPPSKDALSLSLHGTNRPATGAVAPQADALGGWNERGSSAGYDLEHLTRGSDPGSEAGVTAVDAVQQAALARYVDRLQAEAAGAVTDKEEWESHLTRCVAEELKDAEWRRALNKDHSEQLRMQMQHTEVRRSDGREHCVQQASMHNFPNFGEHPEVDIQEYVSERRGHLKEDLEQQIMAKQKIKDLQKEQERTLAAFHVQASQQELSEMKQGDVVKRLEERAFLNDAWNQQRHLKSVTTAIQEHHKAPGKKAGVISGLLNDLGVGLDAPGGGHGAPRAGGSLGGRGGTGGSARQGQGTPRGLMRLESAAGSEPRMGLMKYEAGLMGVDPYQAAAGPPGGGQRLTPRRQSGGSDGGSSGFGSRPPTGGNRRMPLGAAGSLALYKERMGATSKR